MTLRKKFTMIIVIGFLGIFIFGLLMLFVWNYFVIGLLLFALILSYYMQKIFRCPRCNHIVFYNSFKIFEIEIPYSIPWVPKKCPKCDENLLGIEYVQSKGMKLVEPDKRIFKKGKLYIFIGYFIIIPILMIITIFIMLAKNPFIKQYAFFIYVVVITPLCLIGGVFINRGSKLIEKVKFNNSKREDEHKKNEDASNL